MDALNVSSAHILGHDMGASLREFTETYQHKVISLTIVSAKREDITHGLQN